MTSASYEEIREGKIRGWIDIGVVRLLPPTFFEDPLTSMQAMGGEIIKESTWRWAALFPVASGERIFLKRDRTKGPLEYLKYLILPSKARKEWAIATELEKRNVRIPKPVGWMEKSSLGLVKESYYLSEARGSGLSAFDTPERLRVPSVIAQLARSAKAFHDAGLYHRDFHAGNFLWENSSLALTDLHSASILGTVSLRRRLWNLTHLFHSVKAVWTEKEQREFLDAYFEGEACHLQKNAEFLQRIHRGMDRLEKKQWRSRTKRCLKNSTEFSVQIEGALTFLRRRDFPLDQVKKVLDRHRTLMQEKPEALLKCSPEIIVSVIEEDGQKIAVKHFRYPRLLDRLKDVLRRPKGRKAWVGGHGLKVRGIASVQPLALAEQNHWLGFSESFLFMETIPGGLELDRFILQGFGDFRKKRCFIKSFATWLAGLYQKNIYHSDMKTCNLLVVEEKGHWDFHLLDLEDVRFDQTITGKKVLRNFLQLNTSTPKVITRTDRLRFFRECLRLFPGVENPKRLLGQVAETSRRRDLVYVSPEGVVIKKM
jgi:tRNA A-37 threonylcarbamoyl transferase component Bud32